MGFFAVSSSATERGIAERRQLRLAALAPTPVAVSQIEYGDTSPAWFRDAIAAIERISAPSEVTREFARDIMREIADRWGVSVEDLKGPRRERKTLSLARQHAIYEVVRRCPHLSIIQISKMFNRDHTTGLHSLKVWPARAAALGIRCEPLNRPVKP